MAFRRIRHSFFYRNRDGTSLNQASRDFVVVHYGNSDRATAGMPGFGEFFEAFVSELRESGKRPDLLLFDADYHAKEIETEDVTEWDLARLRQVAQAAFGAIEVRSSKYLALTYANVKKRMLEEHPKYKGRTQQSFTVKFEDIAVARRWIEYHGVPLFYAQVFFDSAYGISFEGILRALDTGKFTVEKNRRNQEKPTFHITVDQGFLISRFQEVPTEFESKMVVFPDGRIAVRAQPIGGSAPIEPDAIRQILGR